MKRQTIMTRRQRLRVIRTVLVIVVVLAILPAPLFFLGIHQPVAYYGLSDELVCVLDASGMEIPKVFKVVAKTAYSQFCPIDES